MTLAPQIEQARRVVEVAQAHLRGLLLLAVAERDGTDCRYCAVPTIVDPPAGQRYRERTLDHVVPLSRGGADTLEHCVLCCRSCNARKGTRPQHAYARRTV